jgi:hypothetical protein
MVKEPKAGDLIVHRKDGKRYRIERVGRAIMVGPIFWFIDQEGREVPAPKSKYFWNGEEWSPKEEQ